MHLTRSSLIGALALVTLSAGASAQGATQAGSATAPAAPEVGQKAPAFTLPWADGSGARATPVSLAAAVAHAR